MGLHGLHGTYDDALTWLHDPQNRSRPTVILTMGSSLGNFNRPAAAEFLAQYAQILGPSDLLVVGLDGCTDPDKVHRAYNDSRGVTRRFYENGLRNANSVLGYEAFRPEEWEVVTEYDPVKGRHQAAYSPNTDVTINGKILRAGEKFVFEEAYKYSPEERDKLWRDAGLIHTAEFGNRSDDYRMLISTVDWLCVTIADWLTLDVHLLSSARLDFPTEPSQYAVSAMPTCKEFQALWTSWDIATKAMVPREELLSKPIKLRNALIFYLGHIPTFLGEYRLCIDSR